METNSESCKGFASIGERIFDGDFQTGILYPSIVCGVSLFLNLFIWGKRSSGAVPFSTMMAILLMWFGISFPLVFMGFYFGYRKQVRSRSSFEECPQCECLALRTTGSHQPNSSSSSRTTLVHASSLEVNQHIISIPLSFILVLFLVLFSLVNNLSQSIDDADSIAFV